ncbi:MAG: hypothetical protein WCK78_17870 [Paludibacter sp.]
MNEFAACARAGKSVRVGLSMLMKQMSDARLTGRLTAIMKKINLEDQSEARGYRAILISTQSKYLLGLNFNKDFCFDSSFIAPLALTNNEARNSSTLTVPAFNPAKSVIAPNGATHFRLINAVSVISDFAFNATTGVYEPIQPELNETSNVAYSAYLDLKTDIAAPTVLASALPGDPEMTDDVTVLNSVGIEFYQKAGNDYYLLNAGHALKIQSTF